MKLLSISIAAYNAGPYLRTCVGSLVKSKYLEQLDIMIINDGSKDNTSTIAQEFASQYPDSIRAIDKENGGHGSTINTGIANATGKYFKLLDSDDSYDTEQLDAFVARLETCTEDLALNDYHTVTPEGKDRVDSCSIHDLEYNKEYDFEQYCQNINIAMHSFTFRTEILKGMPYRVDEHCYYVDVEYTLYPMTKIHSFIAFEENVYRYVVGYSEQSVNFNSLIKNREQHKKVVLHIVDFFNKEQAHLKGNTVEVVRKRILDMIEIQYRIYFFMEANKDTCTELKNFDQQLKAENAELYGDLSAFTKGKASYLSFLRKTNFSTYTAIVNTVRWCKSIGKK
jgi:glycosyltransferase involved in cell wall biosynthesis